MVVDDIVVTLIFLFPSRGRAVKGLEITMTAVNPSPSHVGSSVSMERPQAT